ncbi:hypothetical protein [Streptomyces sp. NPDC054797]
MCLSADSTLPKIDVATLGDTRWKPKKVYEHLEHEIAAPAGPDTEALEAGAVDGYSPWACRGEQPEPVRDDFGLAV